MAGMLDLGDVFELIVNRFEQRSLAQYQFVQHGQEFVLHVFAQFGNELYILGEESRKARLGDVAPIPKTYPASELKSQTLGTWCQEQEMDTHIRLNCHSFDNYQ